MDCPAVSPRACPGKLSYSPFTAKQHKPSPRNQEAALFIWPSQPDSLMPSHPASLPLGQGHLLGLLQNVVAPLPSYAFLPLPQNQLSNWSSWAEMLTAVCWPEQASCLLRATSLRNAYAWAVGCSLSLSLARNHLNSILSFLLSTRILWKQRQNDPNRKMRSLENKKQRTVPELRAWRIKKVSKLLPTCLNKDASESGHLWMNT